MNNNSFCEKEFQEFSLVRVTFKNYFLFGRLNDFFLRNL